MMIAPMRRHGLPRCFAADFAADYKIFVFGCNFNEIIPFFKYLCRRLWKKRVIGAEDRLFEGDY